MLTFTYAHRSENKLIEIVQQPNNSHNIKYGYGKIPSTSQIITIIKQIVHPPSIIDQSNEI